MKRKYPKAPKKVRVIASSAAIRAMRKASQECKTFTAGRYAHRDTGTVINREEFWGRM